MGRAGGSDTLGRHQQPRQPHQAHGRFFLLARHVRKLAEHQPSAFEFIHMRVALDTDEQVAKLQHFIGHIGMQVQHHTDGHIRAEFFPDSPDDLPVRVRVAVRHTGAVEIQGDGIQGLFPVSLPQHIHNAITVVFQGFVGDFSRRTQVGHGRGGKLNAPFFRFRQEAAQVLSDTAMGIHSLPYQAAAVDGRPVHRDIGKRVGLVVKTADTDTHIKPPKLRRSGCGADGRP